MVTSEQVRHAKPDPDLFIKAAELLGVDSATEHGRRRQRLGPFGGTARRRPRGRTALRWLRTRGARRAGAYRVYDDPLDLHDHLDEVGIRTRSLSVLSLFRSLSFLPTEAQLLAGPRRRRPSAEGLPVSTPERLAEDHTPSLVLGAKPRRRLRKPPRVGFARRQSGGDNRFLAGSPELRG